MNTERKARALITNSGRKQSWIVQEMNRISPGLKMTPSKLSESINGKREMSADELVAFCTAINAQLSDLLTA